MDGQETVPVSHDWGASGRAEDGLRHARGDSRGSITKQANVNIKTSMITSKARKNKGEGEGHLSWSLLRMENKGINIGGPVVQLQVHLSNRHGQCRDAEAWDAAG